MLKVNSRYKHINCKDVSIIVISLEDITKDVAVYKIKWYNDGHNEEISEDEIYIKHNELINWRKL